MSDDPVTESPSLDKITLWEKRQQYEDWLQSGRRTPRPIPQLHTGVAHTRIDDVEATKVHTPPTIGTINELPAGAIVRTDEGNDERVVISDGLRLDMGKALIKKAEGADVATAERIANAVHTILGPITRADDAKADAEVKNKVLEKSNLGKPKSPGATKADEEGEEKPRKATDEDEPDAPKEPTLADVIAALVKLNGRMDTIEGKKKDNDEEEDDSASEDVPKGNPKELAADDAEYRSDALRRRTRIERMDSEIHSWKNQDRFAEFQARADRVSQLFGKSVGPPMQGETLGAYKRRTVKEWQHLSPAFKNSDLKVLQVADGPAFNTAINDILARADAEGRNPSKIPMGYLAERSEVKGGHQYTRFYGRPATWMNTFAPTGKRVRRIIERGDSGISRTLYERA